MEKLRDQHEKLLKEPWLGKPLRKRARSGTVEPVDIDFSFIFVEGCRMQKIVTEAAVSSCQVSRIVTINLIQLSHPPYVYKIQSAPPTLLMLGNKSAVHILCVKISGLCAADLFCGSFSQC